EDPILHRDLYRALGQKPLKGILLEGPTGVGKTHLARAMATGVCALHNAKPAESGLLVTKGPELLNKYIGESEAGVRRLFESARRHHKEHGCPAIVLLDEADALLGKRGSTRWEGMERTIVPQFLAEMDGMEESHAFVVLTTNRADMLDEAILRP